MESYLSVRDIRLRNYQAATEITQEFLDATLAGGENQLEATCTITKDSNIIRVSNIPKYVGNDFYEGRAKLPQIKRTLGDFLSSSIQFSDATIEINNVDGIYNEYFLGGDNFITFVGATIVFQFGLRDVESSYQTMFTGYIKDELGIKKDKDKITFSARDSFEFYNRPFNLPAIDSTTFPTAPADIIGKTIPYAMGDWTIGYNTATGPSVNVSIAAVDVGIQTYVPASTGFYGGLIGYNVGAGTFIFATGNYTPDTIQDVAIKRGDVLLRTNFTAAPVSSGGYWSVDILGYKKSSDGTSASYTYIAGDIAIISVKIPYAVSKYNNILEQAQRILIDVAGATVASFHSNWSTYIAKSTPAQSSISTIKSRVWIGDGTTNILEYVLGMLEQVRLELFIDRDLLFKINPLHFEDWEAVASMRNVQQIEVIERSINTELDDKNFFNGAKAEFAFFPITDKTALETSKKKNATSVTLSGKLIEKVIVFPNLYVLADVNYQLIEILRFYSQIIEYVNVQTAWTGILDDLGDFLNFNFDLGAISYSGNPCMIRDFEINFDNGICGYRLLSLYGFDYPNYISGFTGLLSSYSQTITDY